LLHAFDDGMAALVISHGANEENVMVQIAKVCGEIERSAAQVFGRADYVPQYLADADRLHCSLDGLNICAAAS
jgi:hypothetical protein